MLSITGWRSEFFQDSKLIQTFDITELIWQIKIGNKLKVCSSKSSRYDLGIIMGRGLSKIEWELSVLKTSGVTIEKLFSKAV